MFAHILIFYILKYRIKNGIVHMSLERYTLQDRLISFVAGMVFAVPTAGFIWLFTNTKLAVWGPDGAFLGSTGFWAVLGGFTIIALVAPDLFPDFLGKVWQTILRVGHWW
ncbi:hypothetical protein [Neptunomonas sp.]|uniref:hypothetical protein n=1 Tax=Neptunomonas TaxID=75687 RepID=UPI0035161624